MLEFVIVGTLLGLVQIGLALPWIASFDPVGFRRWCGRFYTTSLGLQVGGVILVGLIVVSALFHQSVSDPGQLTLFGRIYASLLHFQLAADLFVVLFLGLLKIWPQGSAVALAAFREGIRQPMFWLLGGVSIFLLTVAPFIPYFTFGEDGKMVKEIGYDTIMLAATAFGVIAASMSISEEIEGKTAITLMSKPISRRQFLLGKFVGILLAALAMTLILGWWFIWMILLKERWDPANPLEKTPDPDWIVNLFKNLEWQPAFMGLTHGSSLWADDLLNVGLGLVLGFCQLMVLLAIAVALATRMPMIVNVVICLVIFFLGRLAPILQEVSENRNALVNFTAKLFNTILPGLEHYDMGPAIVRDYPVPLAEFASYVGSVGLYSIVYTAIALLFGLILFEDRDLA